MSESNIRKLQAPVEGGRVETGPVQFGDDWPGVFIRGDDAFAIRAQLEWLSELLEESYVKPKEKA